MDSLLSFDFELYKNITEKWTSPPVDIFMLKISNSSFLIVIYLILFSISIAKKDRKTLFLLFISIFSIYIMNLFCSNILKPFVARERPCHNPDIINMLVSCKGKYGFVSNHSANAFYIASLCYVSYKKWFGYLMLFVAFLAAYSRVYIGVHYPLDSICGSLIGVLFFFYHL